ncbi:MAG: hypothetical protein EA405_03255 [Rhodospirillales bacterium]|nr:MAG: hypothetical protein EA405_03255 [Rhodospirillales bacterium]
MATGPASIHPGRAVLGFVVPSYSPNDFIGMWMGCSSGTVTALFDMDADSLRDGEMYTVALTLDDRPYRFTGIGVFDDMDGAVMLSATLDGTRPPVSELPSAKTLSVRVGDSVLTLPVTGLSAESKRFIAACSGR